MIQIIGTGTFNNRVNDYRVMDGESLYMADHVETDRLTSHSM